MQNLLLASGPYLAMWPAFMVRFGGKNISVKLLPIKFSVVPEPVGIITPKARSISPVARLFIDCIRELTKSMAGA